MPAPVITSPKTTAAAIAIIVLMGGYVAYQFFMGYPGDIEWSAVAASLIAAIGFLVARDNNKSSEDVGIKPK